LLRAEDAGEVEERALKRGNGDGISDGDVLGTKVRPVQLDAARPAPAVRVGMETCGRAGIVRSQICRWTAAQR
jgi:hypothetical protein